MSSESTDKHTQRVVPFEAYAQPEVIYYVLKFKSGAKDTAVDQCDSDEKTENRHDETHNECDNLDEWCDDTNNDTDDAFEWDKTELDSDWEHSQYHADGSYELKDQEERNRIIRTREAIQYNESLIRQHIESGAELHWDMIWGVSSNFDLNDGGDNDCIICYQSYVLYKSKSIGCVTTPCGHTFHTKCLNTWKQQKNSCPMCRRAL
jgi:hypothetical protein